MSTPTNNASTEPFDPIAMLNDKPMLLNPQLAKAIGLNAAIVFRQIHYWLELNREAQREYDCKEGRYWTFNSYEAWQKTNFIWWGETTIRQAFKTLEHLGLVDVGHFNRYKVDNTKWWTIDYDTFTAFMKMWQAAGCPKAGDGPKSKEYKAFLAVWSDSRTPTHHLSYYDRPSGEVQQIPETSSETNYKESPPYARSQASVRLESFQDSSNTPARENALEPSNTACEEEDSDLPYSPSFPGPALAGEIANLFGLSALDRDTLEGLAMPIDGIGKNLCEVYDLDPDGFLDRMRHRYKGFLEVSGRHGTGRFVSILRKEVPGWFIDTGVEGPTLEYAMDEDQRQKRAPCTELETRLMEYFPQKKNARISAAVMRDVGQRVLINGIVYPSLEELWKTEPKFKKYVAFRFNIFKEQNPQYFEKSAAMQGSVNHFVNVLRGYRQPSGWWQLKRISDKREAEATTLAQLMGVSAEEMAKMEREQAAAEAAIEARKKREAEEANE